MNLPNDIDLSRAIICADDTTIRKFLLAENLLGRLEPDPPRNQASLVWRSTDTHTYCFCVNSRVPGDEGYVLTLFPWDAYTVQEAARAIAVIQTCDCPLDGTEIEVLLDLDGKNN